MSWRDIITKWLPKEGFVTQGKISTTNLVEILVEKNIIPPGIKDNATLHGVLLTRILLETLDATQVPRAPQVTNGSGHCNFSYRMNAKEILKWSMGSKNQKELEALEKETGVSLEHYHKLNKFGTLPQKESRKRKCDTEAKVTTNIPFKITRDEKEKTL